jgi:uncharacterized protein YfiM (DUF2279 family)
MPIDKQLHFLWSFAIAVGASRFTQWGWIVALAFGVGKEWYDSRQMGNRWWDLVADGLGVGMAVMLLLRT